MEGEEYLGCVLAVRLPRNEHPNHPCPASPAAGAPQNPPAAPRALLLMISNLPADATAAQLAAFMRCVCGGLACVDCASVSSVPPWTLAPEDLVNGLLYQE